MQTIWRIENEEGVGPYQGDMDDSSLAELISSHNTDNTKPAPCDDQGIRRYPEGEEICGFKDMAQVREWFDRDILIALYAEGYKLKKIVVSVVTAVGQKQVLAIKWKGATQ